MSYIDRKEARELMEQALVDEWEIQYADDRLDEIPAADVVEVVRCKDCRYSYDDMGGLCCSHGVCVDCVVPEDFFCRYGKRKGGDE